MPIVTLFLYAGYSFARTLKSGKVNVLIACFRDLIGMVEGRNQVFYTFIQEGSWIFTRSLACSSASQFFGAIINLLSFLFKNAPHQLKLLLAIILWLHLLIARRSTKSLLPEG